MKMRRKTRRRRGRKRRKGYYGRVYFAMMMVNKQLFRVSDFSPPHFIRLDLFLYSSICIVLYCIYGVPLDYKYSWTLKFSLFPWFTRDHPKIIIFREYYLVVTSSTRITLWSVYLRENKNVNNIGNTLRSQNCEHFQPLKYPVIAAYRKCG